MRYSCGPRILVLLLKGKCKILGKRLEQLSTQDAFMYKIP